jgi:signal peptidase I
LKRMFFLFMVYVFTSLTILTACTNKVTDTVTERQIKVIENPPVGLTRVRVETDGMLADFYSHAYSHPFGLTQEVLVDFEFYKRNRISRGDIVVFQITNGNNQMTDIARVVGLPGEEVEIRNGTVYINQNELDTFYGKDSTSETNDSIRAVQLNEDEYYILADVRWRGMNDSQSTKDGFHKDQITGKVVGYEQK